MVELCLYSPIHLHGKDLSYLKHRENFTVFLPVSTVTWTEDCSLILCRGKTFFNYPQVQTGSGKRPLSFSIHLHDVLKCRENTFYIPSSVSV
jgi:hypothetical protein